MKTSRILLAGSILAVVGCGNKEEPKAKVDSDKPLHVGGDISKVTKDSFVVTGSRGTFTVNIGKANVTVRKKEATASDLKDDAFVIVTGKKVGEDKIDATKIEVQHFKGDLPDKPASQAASKI